MKVYISCIRVVLAFEYNTHKNCHKNIKNTKKRVAPTYKFNIILYITQCICNTCKKSYSL